MADSAISAVAAFVLPVIAAATRPIADTVPTPFPEILAVFNAIGNVLVYSRDASEPPKQKQAMAWMARLWSEQTGRLSFQVLNEFYVTVTNKLQPGMDPQNAREDVRLLLAWRPITLDSRVVEEAWRIQDRYSLSWWDALVVSAAQVGDCRYLLTEGLQENQNLGNVKVINPFHTPPESIFVASNA